MSAFDMAAASQDQAADRVRQEATQYEQYRANLENRPYNQHTVDALVDAFRRSQSAPARSVHPAFDPGW